MRLYNFLSRKVEEFKPIGKTVGLYTCGPTVYDFVHIGNWRTFVFEDVLKRALIFNGYKVKHVMNLTDIDDKVIKRAKEEKTTIGDLTEKYAKAFFADLEKLNILRADKYPKAAGHITSIIRIIEVLIEKKFAYVRDGSIYFSIAKFKGYGKLSGANIKGIKPGARVDVDEYDKDNPQDFALWKKETDSAKVRGEAFDSPWGVGRPGWHIECSAMGMEYLGESFDIHTGGVDLLFPHHENEIAQSESATGKKFVNFWLEGEHLLVESEKMAKRLGNIFTLEDIKKKKFDPVALRYLFLTAHYRSKLNFTWKSLDSASRAISNFKFHFLQENLLEASISNLNKSGESKPDKKLLQDFKDAVNNDLDMPKAVVVFHKVLKSDTSEGTRYQTLIEMDEVLGLGLANIKKLNLPKGAKELISEREELRRMGEFEESDKIRDELKSMGVEVEDTQDGPKWKVTKSKSK